MAARLAADDAVVPLSGLTPASFGRRLTSGETHLVRTALLGFDPADAGRTDETPASVVGYVCAGRPAVSDDGFDVVAVTDHVNLTWRSPLTGRNDGSLGPRFPVVAGVYVPGLVLERLGTQERPAVRPMVVAGVRDVRVWNEFEREIIQGQGLEAVSSELVPVALLAAHLGTRLAAVVLVGGSDQNKGES
jgi:hypothetical protein